MDVSRNTIEKMMRIAGLQSIPKTEHPTKERKLYRRAVPDAFSRKMGGWSIDYN